MVVELFLVLLLQGLINRLYGSGWFIWF